jgi:hypothetical protein
MMAAHHTTSRSKDGKYGIDFVWLLAFVALLRICSRSTHTQAR